MTIARSLKHVVSISLVGLLALVLFTTTGAAHHQLQPRGYLLHGPGRHRRNACGR